MFHWSCLDHVSRQLRPTTAPAGYTCPSCRHPLFPPHNLISPVADVLKEKLAGVNWARAGLGLPLVSISRFLNQVKCNKLDFFILYCFIRTVFFFVSLAFGRKRNKTSGKSCSAPIVTKSRGFSIKLLSFRCKC